MEPTTDDGAGPPAPELSASRRRLFSALTLALPLMFFGLLEGGLRLAGYGGDYPLFVEVDGAPGTMMPSREVARRYFAAQASVPTPNPDFFDADKGDGTVRIVAQGGSTAAGYPFYRGAAFPQVLATRLRLAYPDADIEMVNTAMAAVNSYTLLDIVDEILAQEPDAVVIYAGHNEFYGALGAASTETLGRSPGLVRAYLRFRRFRTVQLVGGVVGRVMGVLSEREAGAPPSTTLMARMIGEQNVPMDSDTYRAGLHQFSENLDLLLAAYAEAGVPVYISTLASNERDQRPFTTSVADATDLDAWQAAAQAGIDRLEAGDAAGAIPLLREAIALDAGAADPYFALGRALLAVGQPDRALAAFVSARDLDALRFRAPESFNAVIRDAAARHGATVVEGLAALRERSKEGIVGRRMMLEHLHPTLDGYSVLADAFFAAIIADGRVSDAPPQPTPAGRYVRLVTPMDSLAGLTRVAQLTQSWPFRPEEAQPLRLDTTRTPAYVADFAQRVLRGSGWLQAADSLATLLERDGRIRDALVTRRAVVQAYPFLAEPLAALAALELGRVRASGQTERMPYVAGLYQRALEINPTNVPSLAMLGALALQAGDHTAAIGFLERARALAPDTPQVLYNLSGAYMLEGRRDDAIALAERLVRLDAGNASYRALLDGLRQSRTS